MKRSLFLLVIVVTAHISFSQEKKQINIANPQDVQRRIDMLLNTNQYPPAPGTLDVGSLISLGTKIKRDTASCTLGALKKKKSKKYKPAYIVRYSIKADKIVAIDQPKKKKKRFILF